MIMHSATGSACLSVVLHSLMCLHEVCVCKWQGVCVCVSLRDGESSKVGGAVASRLT